MADDAADRARRHRARRSSTRPPRACCSSSVSGEQAGRAFAAVPDGDERRGHRRRGARRRDGRRGRPRLGAGRGRGGLRRRGRAARLPRRQPHPRAGPGGGMLPDLRDGWREFAGRPWLWASSSSSPSSTRWWRRRGGLRAAGRRDSIWAGPGPGGWRWPPSVRAPSAAPLLMMRVETAPAAARRHAVRVPAGPARRPRSPYRCPCGGLVRGDVRHRRRGRGVRR